MTFTCPKCHAEIDATVTWARNDPSVGIGTGRGGYVDEVDFEDHGCPADVSLDELIAAAEQAAYDDPGYDGDYGE